MRYFLFEQERREKEKAFMASSCAVRRRIRAATKKWHAGKFFITRFPMKSQLFLFCAAIMTLLTGCTFVGVPTTLDLKTASGITTPVPAKISLGSVTRDVNAGVNLTVHTMNVGHFGDTDLRVLAESLTNQFRRMSLDGAASLVVSVRFKRYVQAFSNSEGAAAAVVEFDVRRDGKVTFSDRFYAARDFGRPGVVPLGVIKDRFNRAILTRIVCEVAAVAKGETPTRTYEWTYNDLEAALAVLPREIHGTPNGLILIGRLPTREIPWREVLTLEKLPPEFMQ
jgi:hypothetical protein